MLQCFVLVCSGSRASSTRTGLTSTHRSVHFGRNFALGLSDALGLRPWAVLKTSRTVSRNTDPPSQWITYIYSIPLSRYSTSHLVPSRAPTNITVENHGLNEFLVKWNPLPIQEANGRILGYNVYYKTFKQLYYSFPDNISRINNTNMPRVILPNIRTGVTYIISVAAFTSVGTGPRSYPVYKEKGKYIKPKAKISRAAEKNG